MDRIVGPGAGEAGCTIRFDALLAAGTMSAEARVPADAVKGVPWTGFVEGTMEGFPFRAPAAKSPSGEAVIVVSPSLAAAVGAGPGDSVAVELTRLGDEPEVRTPADLLAALGLAPSALELWQKVTPMARREWVRWIASAKKAETRSRRIAAACDMLAQGKRRPCCFPGINWVTKGLVAPEETWAPL